MAALELGVLVNLTENPEELFAPVRDLGLTTCQLCSWKPHDITPALAERARQAAEAAGVRITLFWCGYSGPGTWDFVDGPGTIGLVPAAYREGRTAELIQGAQVGAWLGVTDLATHVGFLPVNAKDPDYLGTVDSLKRVAEACAAQGQHFDFETGQETPLVLRRTMADIGAPNLGVNLDPANLLMYGMANPVDALDVFGTYVRGVHAKDGEYPTDAYNLGVEKPLGDGRVDFGALVPRLKACGYTGALTIEREISGPQQIADIQSAMTLLKPLL